MKLLINHIYESFKLGEQLKGLPKAQSLCYKHNRDKIIEGRSAYDHAFDEFIKSIHTGDNYDERREEFEKDFASKYPEYAKMEALRKKESNLKIARNRLLQQANIKNGAIYALSFSQNRSQVLLYEFYEDGSYYRIDLSSYSEEFLTYLRNELSKRETNVYIRDIEAPDIVLLTNIIDAIIDENPTALTAKNVRIKYLEALAFEYKEYPDSILRKEQNEIKRERYFLEAQHEKKAISDKEYKLKSSELDILETKDPEMLYINCSPADKETLLTAYMNLEKCGTTHVRTRGVHINLAVRKKLKEIQK